MVWSIVISMQHQSRIKLVFIFHPKMKNEMFPSLLFSWSCWTFDAIVILFSQKSTKETSLCLSSVWFDVSYSYLLFIDEWLSTEKTKKKEKEKLKIKKTKRQRQRQCANPRIQYCCIISTFTHPPPWLGWVMKLGECIMH